MPQPQTENFQTFLGKQNRQLLERGMGVREWAKSGGTLSAKVKALIALLTDAKRDRFEVVPVMAQRVRGLGATEAELAWTIGVTFWLGGVHALSTASEAFRK